MFGRRSPGFGRRNRQPEPALQGFPAHPGPDDDGVTRLIPKEIWDSPAGALLRQVGLSPDDPANLAPTPELMQARQDRLDAELITHVETINAQLPPRVKVLPWAMLPWSLWSGPRARFLTVTCERLPSSPANAFLLAADVHSSTILKLPLHPRCVPAEFARVCDRIVGEVEDEFRPQLDAIGARIQTGDTTQLSAFAEKAREAAANVNGVAHAMTAKLFGDAAYQRHRDLFAQALGWVRD